MNQPEPAKKPSRQRKPVTAAPAAPPSVVVELLDPPVPVATFTTAQSVVREPPLLSTPSFQMFWSSRTLTQAAQGATIYALFILLVDHTDSAIHNAAFVLCAIIPSILFGLPGGLVADAIPKRPLLMMLNLLRVVFLIALATREVTITGIYAAAFGFWMIHQFYAPAESATMASLTPAHRYSEAQALSNLALTLGQVTGIVIMAPLILKTGQPELLFGLCALLVSVALILVAMLPPVVDQVSRSSAHLLPADPWQALTRGVTYVRQHPLVRDVVTADVLAGIGLSALVVLAPLYLTHILDTSAENTVFVFAPAAIGLLIGLRTAPDLCQRFTNRSVAIWGLFLFAFCIALFGFIDQIHTVLADYLHIPVDSIARTLHLAPLAGLVMILSIPSGYFSSVVNVASRSALLEATPAEMRGQAIAAQSMIQNILALLPTILVGIMAELIGVEQVAVLTALLITLGALTTIHRDRLTALMSSEAA